MSVNVRFVYPRDGGGISRSLSFAGFSAMHSRKIPNSLSKSSVRSKMSVKSVKLYPSLQKGSTSLDPQPHQVKKIFEALKRGIIDYLEAHQVQLDFLTAQQKDLKRNSRLAYFYDLDKEIRFIERYIRKLEFHVSKIEELFETYCIQWRLRDGACNMKHAFSLSPSTKASRESLVELYKNFQECTEDMCLIAGALEMHLGEFHIKMKGLVGYARLCPGDNYEVLVRLGRQRWRLKGKIETDDSQMWDEEDRVFIPTLHENFEIKVIELRGLTTVLVGLVTCDSADFFTARPRTIIVDITELGTIKLQLEVTWNPFDNEKLLLSSGSSSTTKSSATIRRTCLYNWTPPNTPCFKEKYFLSLLQQQSDLGNTFSSTESEDQASCILSYLADSDFDVHFRTKSPDDSITNQSECVDSAQQVIATTDLADRDGDAATLQYDSLQELPTPKREVEDYLQTPSHKTLDILRETPLQAFKPTKLDFAVTEACHPDDMRYLQDRLSPSIHKTLADAGNAAHVTGCTHLMVRQFDEVFDLLKLKSEGQANLQELSQQILSFKDRLKPKPSSRKHSSMESLMVETVLESFDFLNGDLSADEMSLFGSVRTCSKSNSTSHGESLQSLGSSIKTAARELTTGSEVLDVLLTVHLQVCKALLQKLVSPDVARITQRGLLEELSAQKHMLESLSLMSVEKAGPLSTVEELFPRVKKIKYLLKVWNQCTEPESTLLCPTERFLNQLKKTFMSRIKGKYPGQLETVVHRLLEQIASCGGLLSSTALPEDLLTFFLLHDYLKKQNVVDLEKHLAALTKEVTLIEDLQVPGRLKKIKKLKGKRLRQLQPLPQTLRMLAILQLDENLKVCKAAKSCLCRAATHKPFRDKAGIFYTEILQGKDVHLQQAACLALKHLRVKESIEQIACLCQSEVEEVRTTARGTVLSFGTKGRLAFEKKDKICRDLQGTLYQDDEIEITIF
ncbi:RIPOR family member 3 [Ambystoma mexicanum]|uniref:RIPOR family member 3 n=1 Tax=Ambystoma mexicanum TaxID=8296 RepID=UPI0037E7E793